MGESKSGYFAIIIPNESEKSDRVDLVFRVLLGTGSPKNHFNEIKKEVAGSEIYEISNLFTIVHHLVCLRFYTYTFWQTAEFHFTSIISSTVPN